MYIDIDVHHGDGVEEAFYLTDRVMTISFHKFGNFFPGTGCINDVGILKGKNYSINVPLDQGIDDWSYKQVFDHVIENSVSKFKPNVIVLQCGADSLAGDRLGCFNLSEVGHSYCIEKVKSFNIPFIMLGGGGYTIKNVAKIWTLETAIACGVDLKKDLPYNEYYEHFGPDYTLEVPTTNITNMNTDERLEKILQQVSETLRGVESAPSVGFTQIPADIVAEDSDEDKIWSKIKGEEIKGGDPDNTKTSGLYID